MVYSSRLGSLEPRMRVFDVCCWQCAGGKRGDIREGAGDNRAVVISFRACTLSALCPLCLSPWEGSPSTGQGCWGAVVGREKPISVRAGRQAGAAWCRKLFRAEGTWDHAWGWHSLEESRMGWVLD